MFDQQKAAVFATRLKRIMQDRDLTQLKIQQNTGLSQQSISGWCRGRHFPRGARLETLASYLEMEARELCPEAFDETASAVATASITFAPVDGQPGWYILRVGGMPVDEQMLRDVLDANNRFGARRKAEGFEDVKLVQ